MDEVMGDGRLARAMYLDPGTGSLIVQSLVAAIAAVGFGMRLYWRRMTAWFKRKGSRD
ncbi:MAG TPA: hypothetical protein VJZ00_21515 [Thermoanaerobaculia bacterium]|nr:hypothetical protein [Thermoanaerobaculia bacterium]